MRQCRFLTKIKQDKSVHYAKFGCRLLLNGEYRMIPAKRIGDVSDSSVRVSAFYRVKIVSGRPFACDTCRFWRAAKKADGRNDAKTLICDPASVA